MKVFASLAIAAMATLSVGAHSADAAKPAHAASAPTAKAKTSCAKGELGGVVTSTKMEGETLVVGFKKKADTVRIRKKDDASTFDKLTKLKVGDLHCYANDGS